MKRVAIIGWGETEFRPHPEHHRTDLLEEATRAALDSASLTHEDLDVVLGASCDVLDGVSISNVFIVESMGGFMKEESKVEDDAAFAVFYGMTRLLAGPNRTALVASHGKPSETPPDAASHLGTDPFYGRPVGLGHTTIAGLQANAYLTSSNASIEDFAALAAKRGRAESAAAALAAPPLAHPLTESMCPPITDGAVAVILAEETLARELCPHPIWIDGVGLSHDLFYPGHRDLSESTSAREAAQRAFAMAGIEDPATAFDLAELSARHPHEACILVEAFGLAEPGDGARFLLEGSLPIDPSGGALCADADFPTGLRAVVAACQQLTGTAGAVQIEGSPRRALAHGSSGAALQANIVFALSREAS